MAFPRHLKSLGASAFFHCSALKCVKFYGDAPHILEELPFGTNVVVEVVRGTKGWNDDPWRSFKIKVVPSNDHNGGFSDQRK